MKQFGIILGLCSFASITFGSGPGYYSQPAIHGNRLIFVSEGDLWLADLPSDLTAPIVANRLTSAVGVESWPTMSPDGRLVAFAGEYDGNVDAYVMPVDGGDPVRLTYHPDPDLPQCFSPDGSEVLFRSMRSNPDSRWELWRVPASGGVETRYEFGECSLATMSSSGRRIAFTRWSNETWNWKRYRGGTAPEIWLANLDTSEYRRLTDNPANDLFPMWVGASIFFLSDRDGFANIWSMSPHGDELKQHTHFAADPQSPESAEGYELRWPQADAARGGTRIAFAQGAAIAILDTNDDRVSRLDIRLRSDFAERRPQYMDSAKTTTEFSLSSDGSRLFLGSRGEILSIPVGEMKPGKSSAAIQLTRSASREWGFTSGKSAAGSEALYFISDASGEQQIVMLDVEKSGAATPAPLTSDRESWLFAPEASPDGRWVAFGDNTGRLHLLNTGTLAKQVVDQADAWEISDYRFSPDSQWLAYTKPMPNSYGMVMLYSVRTARSIPVSDGLANDSEPRWDPAGKFLYFISKRHIDPILGELDFEHALVETSQIMALPLAANTPPPIKALAQRAGFDLEKWSADEAGADKPALAQVAGNAAAEGAQPEPAVAADPQPKPMVIQVDTDGLASRAFGLPIAPGNLRMLEAIHGGVMYLKAPTQGMLEDVWPAPPLGVANCSLNRYDFVEEEAKTLAESVSMYQVSSDASAVAWWTGEKFNVSPMRGDEKPTTVESDGMMILVDQPGEWKQMLGEAWRLQRDFYWAPNMAGVDWPAMRTKYEVLLSRVGNRLELNDLVGQMISELGTSHTYVWGGESIEKPRSVNVGLLGIDMGWDGNACRIKRILPSHLWSDELVSPLAMPHLDVHEGQAIIAINGVPVATGVNPYSLLQDQAGKTVRLTIADDGAGTNSRIVEITALSTEKPLRYAAWVEANRHYVDKATDGAVGYLHIPDMDSEGLVSFSRLFYPQINRKGLIVDIRGNGGGFISQQIIARLGRKVWGFQQPRHGATERYPKESLHGHIAVVMDQHAGSDGDIFPASFRLNRIGPLIGTRTWGGVVGIRADKPFVDGGLSTQPEFAWWDPEGGWSLENVGVPPDIEVDTTPADRAAARDPQLDRAIEWVQEQIRNNPKTLPEMPPWPDRSKVAKGN